MKKAKKENLKRNRRARRTRAKILGTKDRPRLSVFRSNQYVYGQLIDDEKGHTLASAFSDDSIKAGKLLSEQAIKAGIKEAVFDKGSYKYHGRIKILAEEVRKAGVKI